MNGQGMPRPAVRALLIIVLYTNVAQSAFGVTTATSTNFFVRIDGNDSQHIAFANRCVLEAEALRIDIANDWLGDSLPPVKLRSMISVTLDATESFGRTLPTRGVGGHMVWIKSSQQEAIGTLLAHEMVHCLIADQFGPEFPAWANEGIASRYDCLERQEIRERILRDQVRERLWPNLSDLFESTIRTQEEYSAAASLTQFFLERGTPAKLLQFAVAGNSISWDSALQSYYDIAGTSALQQQWQRWASERDHSPRIALR